MLVRRCSYQRYSKSSVATTTPEPPSFTVRVPQPLPPEARGALREPTRLPPQKRGTDTANLQQLNTLEETWDDQRALCGCSRDMKKAFDSVSKPLILLCWQ